MLKKRKRGLEFQGDILKGVRRAGRKENQSQIERKGSIITGGKKGNLNCYDSSQGLLIALKGCLRIVGGVKERSLMERKIGGRGVGITPFRQGGRQMLSST